jgi:hypothetical protein
VGGGGASSPPSYHRASYSLRWELRLKLRQPHRHGPQPAQHGAPVALSERARPQAQMRRSVSISVLSSSLVACGLGRFLAGDGKAPPTPTPPPGGVYWLL